MEKSEDQTHITLQNEENAIEQINNMPTSKNPNNDDGNNSILISKLAAIVENATKQIKIDLEKKITEQTTVIKTDLEKKITEQTTVIKTDLEENIKEINKTITEIKKEIKSISNSIQDEKNFVKNRVDILQNYCAKIIIKKSQKYQPQDSTAYYIKLQISSKNTIFGFLTACHCICFNTDLNKPADIKYIRIKFRSKTCKVTKCTRLNELDAAFLQVECVRKEPENAIDLVGKAKDAFPGEKYVTFTTSSAHVGALTGIFSKKVEGKSTKLYFEMQAEPGCSGSLLMNGSGVCGILTDITFIKPEPKTDVGEMTSEIASTNNYATGISIKDVIKKLKQKLK